MAGGTDLDDIESNAEEKNNGSKEDPDPELDYQNLMANLSVLTIEEGLNYSSLENRDQDGNGGTTNGDGGNGLNDSSSATVETDFNPIGHDRNAKTRSLDVQPVGRDAETSFEDLQLQPQVLQGLKDCRFLIPSPIQVKAIPLGKFGYDLILQSKSGTGKTCAFGVIVLENFDNCADELETIQAIIISPTREIACQSKTVLKAIGVHIHGLRIKVFIGGTSVIQSIHRSKACNIVSGTPGRILHMISTQEMDVSKVKIVVLDEADRLMESAFLGDVEAIFEALPQEKQVIAASATYPNELRGFVKRFMRDPEEVTTDYSNELLGVRLYAADVLKIMNLDKDKDRGKVTTVQLFDLKMKVVLQILQNLQYSQAIIFSRSVLTAGKIFEELTELNFDVALFTGAMSQQNRLNSFRHTKSGRFRILVSSDLASRGLDIEGVDLVINFELPDDPSTFVHRYGRAGRFGSQGISISLIAFGKDYHLLSEYITQNKINVRILASTENIQNLGQSRPDKLRKICRRGETFSLDHPAFKNWRQMYKLFFTPKGLTYPSLELDSLAGFTLDCHFENVVKRKNELQRIFES